MVYPKINVGHCDLFFHGSVILPDILMTLGYMSKMLWNYETEEPNVLRP